MDADIENDVRLALESSLDALPVGEDLLEVLAGLGWSEIQELDRTAADRLLFDALGRKLATVRVIDELVADRLTRAGLPIPRQARIVLPHPDPSKRRSGVLLGGRDDSCVLAVPVLDERGSAAKWWIGDGAGAERSPFGVWDESLEWTVVDLESLVSGQECAFEGTDAQAMWSVARTAVQTALAQMLTSICRSMLAIAVEHVSHREQFGRPIGSYQAVQHALAEAYVATEASARAVDVAWSQQTPWSAQVAKALGGRAYVLVARQAQQVTGGMGMSWEFPLHHFVRRGAVLDSMLGTAGEHVVALGRSLVDGRTA